MNYSSLLRAGAMAAVLFAAAAGASPEWALPDETPDDKMLRASLEAKVSAIEKQTAADLEAAASDWANVRPRWQKELKGMLGLDPEPVRGDLNATVTGTLEGDGYVVEKLHFQPVPQLYTAVNLFRPKEVKGPLPAILYVCGHSHVEKDGVSFGNKTDYHQHGVWFARHGYVCLIVDTVQWGEFLGEHHGTYRLGRWWWPSRGYTPSGVEAWTAVRALDYLETRPEVDKTRFGVTGRSGGGAYSWWLTAIDDRVKVAVPTAGITTLRDYVMGGCVEGHCDCMFMNNTQRWDYHKVAALAAPRALLIANTDKDDIFPLSGVMEIYLSTRKLYAALGAEKMIGLQIAEGPHQDTQALNTGAFAWFERHLKGAGPMAVFDEGAKRSIDQEKLRVFTGLPEDERTTTIDGSFVPLAVFPPVPETQAQWETMRDEWLQQLKSGCFAGWQEGTKTEIQLSGNGIGEFLISSPDRGQRMLLFPPRDGTEGITLHAGGLSGMATAEGTGGGRGTILYIPEPATKADARKQNQIRRRLLLTGGTMEEQFTRDLGAAIRFAAQEDSLKAQPAEIRAAGSMAGCALYAAILEPGAKRLVLSDLPESHMQGPCFLNVLRILDMPQAVAMALEQMDVTLTGARPEAWAWAAETAKKLGWKHTLTITPGIGLVSAKKIWDGAPHNAFTSLVRFQDAWYCAFREGSGHIPGTDGTVRVLRSTDAEKWESAAVVTEAGTDLRDAQLSVTPDNRLMLLTGGSLYGGEAGKPGRKRIGTRSRAAFSPDGINWTAPVPVADENEWLWRVTWNGNEASGLSYATNGGFDRLTLWKSADGTRYTRSPVPLPRGLKPSEATIRYTPDGTLLAVVRNEARRGKPGDPKHSPASAWLARRAPGWGEWQWSELGCAVHGPDFLVLPDGRLLFAGRDFTAEGPRTVAGFISEGRAIPLLTLPSGGDTSYPGLAMDEDGTVLMSYYSSHEGKTAVYLARLKISDR